MYAIVEEIQDTLMFHALLAINTAKGELQTLNFEEGVTIQLEICVSEKA